MTNFWYAFNSVTLSNTRVVAFSDTDYNFKSHTLSENLFIERNSNISIIVYLWF